MNPMKSFGIKLRRVRHARLREHGSPVHVGCNELQPAQGSNNPRIIELKSHMITVNATCEIDLVGLD